MLRRRRHRPRPRPGRSAASPSTTPAPHYARCRRSPRVAETGPATVVLVGHRQSASRARSTPSSPSPSPLGVTLCARRRQPAVLALPRRPDRHGHARHHRRHRLRGHVRPGQRQRRRHRRDDAASSTASPSGSWSASTPSATPPRPSPRASPSARPSSPPSPCSPASSRPIAGELRPRDRSRGARDGVAACFEPSPDQRRRPEDRSSACSSAAPCRSCSRALAIRAVGRTAGVVVQEVRKQFADGKIMTGEKEPDYGPVIDICTAASLRELATPALLAVLTPVIIGFGIDFARARRVPRRGHPRRPADGQLPVSNAGGAWDNAKKYIEDGHHGGKGSDAAQGRRHRRHRRRPVQGHRRPGAQPADQGDEPGVAADPAGDHQPPGQRRRPLRDRRRGARRADRRRSPSRSRRPRRRAATPDPVDDRTSVRRPGCTAGSPGARASLLGSSLGRLRARRPRHRRTDHREGRPARSSPAIVFAESGLLIGFFLPGDSLLFIAGFLSSKPDGLPHIAAPLPHRRSSSCSSPRSSATRSATCSAARSVRRCSTGRRSRLFNPANVAQGARVLRAAWAEDRSCWPASCRSCARSRRSSPASAR